MLRLIVRLVGTAMASVLLLLLPYFVHWAPVGWLIKPFYAPGLTVVVLLTPPNAHMPYLGVIMLGFIVDLGFTWLALMLLATAIERYMIRRREQA